MPSRLDHLGAPDASRSDIRFRKASTAPGNAISRSDVASDFTWRPSVTQNRHHRGRTSRIGNLLASGRFSSDL